MRSSKTCKAGLAGSFFEDETCWISACIVLISFLENGIIGGALFGEAAQEYENNVFIEKYFFLK